MLFKCITFLALAAASWWSIRLACADEAFRRGTPAGIARAIELQPENAGYLAALALQAEYSGQDSTPLLQEIARLNPRASAPRIRLGLAAELRGDATQAERWLQEAFSVDRQFETFDKLERAAENRTSEVERLRRLFPWWKTCPTTTNR